jgi:hypothetical protein
MDDDLMAMDAKRRNRMDNKTFDSLLKLTATSTGRRRLFQAAATLGVGGLFTRGISDAVAGVNDLACQRRGSKCTRNRKCKCKGESNVICDPLARGCQSGDRCCGVKGATCDKDCDCCTGYQCNRNRNKCVRAG